jgi:hypothetical protein
MLPRPLALQRDKKSWKDVRTDGAEGRQSIPLHRCVFARYSRPVCIPLFTLLVWRSSLYFGAGTLLGERR